ncbi:MMPL family transporter [Arcanobacterium haemolyticum]|nr:MMPL family transporter [Arcanobacterium haemolyticum]
MFKRLGRGVAAHPWTVVVIWIAVTLLAIVAMSSGFGYGGLFSRTATSDFVVPGSESEKVTKLTGSDVDDEVSIPIVVEGASPDAQAAEFANSHRDELAVSGVETVLDPFVPGLPEQQAQALLATDGSGWVYLINLREGLNDEERTQFHDELTDALGRLNDEMASSIGGTATEVSQTSIADSIMGLIRSDLVRGESLSLPVAALLMVVVFGGLLAACMPLVGAVTAILIGLAALWVATYVTTVDSFILNVVTIIGVALSIDYGLLVVSRFREEGANLLAKE